MNDFHKCGHCGLEFASREVLGAHIFKAVNEGDREMHPAIRAMFASLAERDFDAIKKRGDRIYAGSVDDDDYAYGESLVIWECWPKGQAAPTRVPAPPFPGHLRGIVEVG